MESNSCVTPFGVVLTLGLALLVVGCATPDQARLSQISTLALPDSAAHENEFFRLDVARMSSASLKELFRTKKIEKQFTVCWVSISATDKGPVGFERNRIALRTPGMTHYPVGPGRVAYLSRSKSTGMLIAAVVVPVLVPFGAPIATAGSYNVYAAVNLTGVAAAGHVAGTEESNVKRAQGTRLGSLPDQATIAPGETLAGFLFFETPGAGNVVSILDGELTSGEQPVAFSISGIPEVNPEFGKEKDDDVK